MTQEAKTTVLDAFLKQRAKRQNNTIIEARRLVNLYRHLSLFGADYLEKYNAMLMETTPEVQMALSDIIGGTIVRQYLEFLKGRAQKNDTDMVISDEEANDAYRYRHEESYLPSPDELAPFVFSTPSCGIQMSGEAALADGHAFSSPAMDGAVLSMQEAFFEKALSKQSVFLTEALEKMQQSAMKQAAQNSLPDAVLAELSTLQQSQKETLSELLTKQNEQFVENLNNILKQTQDLSTRQMEMVERLVEKNSKEHWEKDAYAVIEDDMQITSKPPFEPVQRNRSYRSEMPAFVRPDVELEPVGEDIAPVSMPQIDEAYRAASLNTPTQTDEDNK